MMVVDQVFSESVSTAPVGEHATVVEALQAGVSKQLAVLGDANLTGVGASSADLLGVSVEQLAETLTRNLLREIMFRGAVAGPLTPLADQLNQDVTHLQLQQLSGVLARLAEEVREVRATLDQLVPVAVVKPLGKGRPAYIYEGVTVTRLTYRREVGYLLEFYTKVFVGRERELAKLIRFAVQEEPGYALIEAPAGYGKSAVSAQLVHRHESGPWSGSVAPALVYFFVREEGLRHTPAAFCQAVNSQLLDLLELPGGVPAEFEAQRTQLLDLWALAVEAASAERPLLLVVDGLDEIAPGSVTITDLLPTALGPYVHVVVTSRPTPEPFSQVPSEHPLRQAEVTRLQTLDDADVAALLVQQGCPTEFAGAVAARVMTVTKGEPLLARFVTEDVVTGGEGALEGLERDPPAGVKDYFARQFRQLNARATGDMAWKVLGLLLVARGAVAVEELAGVLELPKRQVSTAIAPIRRFLPGRERLELMHLELRAIIAEQFSSAERQAYKARLLSWCDSFRSQGWPHDTPDYVLFHYANHLLEAGDKDTLYSLVDRRWMELKAERTHSHQAFVRDVLLAVSAAAAEKPPNFVQEVRGLLVRATLNSATANVPSKVLVMMAAIGQIDRAMSHAALISDPQRRSEAYVAIAGVVEKEGERSEVLSAFREAASSASSVKDPEEKASALARLSKALLDAGERREALHIAGQALRVAKQLKNRTHKVFALSEIAEALALAGEFDEALAVAEAVDSPVRKPHLLAYIARVLIDVGKSERALRVITILDNSYESLSARLDVLRALANAGEHASAVQQAKQVLLAVEPMTDDRQKVFILANVARTLARAGEGVRAIEVVEQALRSAQATEDRGHALLVLPLLIEALVQAGERARATQVIELVQQAAGSIGDPDERAGVLTTVAMALVYVDKLMEAVELAELTLPAAEAIENAEQQDFALIDIFRVLLGAGKLERALEVVAVIPPNSGLNSQVLSSVARLAARDGELDTALQAAEALGDPGERAFALAGIAEALAEAGDLVQAQRVVERALQAAEALGDPGERAFALAGIAEALAEAGDLVQAQRVVERALQAAEAFGDPGQKACALAEVVKASARTGGQQPAEVIAERALHAAELAGRASQEDSYWLASMAEALIQAGRFEQALHAARLIDRSRSSNASPLIEIASALARAQQFGHALEIADRLDNAIRRAFAFMEIGFALAQSGERARAAELAERVLHAVETTDDAMERVVLLCGAAKILAKTSDLDHAQQIVHRALQIAQAMGGSEMETFAIVRVLETLITVGEPDQSFSIAHKLSDSEHDFAFGGIARAASEVGDFALAMTAAEAIEDLEEKVSALATTADAVGGVEDYGRVAKLVERILSLVESLEDAPKKVWALTTLSRALFRIEDIVQARRASTMTLVAASRTTRSAYLRALGEVLAHSGKAYEGDSETLWAICETVSDVDGWWFGR
jgi:tetratricopeptide (TPR) repeat protein